LVRHFRTGLDRFALALGIFDHVSGKSSSTRSCTTFGVIRLLEAMRG
jgi:hypothetical protein